MEILDLVSKFKTEIETYLPEDKIGSVLRFIIVSTKYLNRTCEKVSHGLRFQQTQWDILRCFKGLTGLEVYFKNLSKSKMSMILDVNGHWTGCNKAKRMAAGLRSNLNDTCKGDPEEQSYVIFIKAMQEEFPCLDDSEDEEKKTFVLV